MSVTFTVEDGTIVEDANSYVELEEAEDYLSIKPNSTSWTALSDQVQEQYLMWATRLIDQRGIFQGSKTDDESALQWPRQNVYDRNMLLVDSDAIPPEIRAATIEIAYHLLSQGVDPSAPPTSTAAASGIKKITAAEVSIEYQDADKVISNSNLFPGGINDILFPFGSIKGSGSGFGRILRV